MKYFKRRRMQARLRIDRRKRFKVRNAATSVVKQSKDASARVRNSAYSSIGWLSEIPQGLLVTELSIELGNFLQKATAGPVTIYDRALDANYLATHIGGSYHRLFDGSHDLFGAVRAARDASPDDSVIQEAIGTLQALFKDVTTVRGLPIATWDYETYYQVVGYLDDNFHIPRNWFYDLNTYDAAELVSSSIGVVALALSWNRVDTETFARLVGSLGLSATLSANPLLMVVTVVALAKAFHNAHESGEYSEFVDGSLKGGIGTGATITAVSLIGVAGGPAGVALLSGLAAGILVNMATKNVSFVEISQFMSKEARVVADEAKGLAKERKISQFMAAQIDTAVIEARRVTQQVKEKYANTKADSI